MVTTGKNLTDFKDEIEQRYGEYYPDRDGVEVGLKGDELLRALDKLKKYDVGSTIEVGGEKKTIKEVISIDGRKMILDDNSWIMIRPSGTEPKVRFYVESRDKKGTKILVETARRMLRDSRGLILQSMHRQLIRTRIRKTLLLHFVLQVLLSACAEKRYN